MNERGQDTRRVITGGPPANASDAGQKDHFLQLMFFQAHHPEAVSHLPQRPDQATGDYAPLRHSLAKPGDRYILPLPGQFASIGLDAPATDVMTDLRRVSAVIIGPDASLDEANQTMIAHRVRALFVVDDGRRVSGIITSTDILGEKPLQVTQERNVRHGEIAVRDVMTSADRLEILDLRDVELARVGDVVATLKVAGRQHALVVETIDEAMTVQRSVRGIFSLTQIARQLGIPPQQIHDIARTFAEIQAAIAS
jgi:CBS domain-containing protein